MGIHALYTAATGMDAQLKNIDVIANNVANLQTVGFRKDRTNFADLFYEHQILPGGNTSAGGVSPTGIHLGHGVRVVSVEKTFEQGGLIPTDSPTHLAIEGNGHLFFKILRANGDVAYTRAGNFTRNSEGFMVTPNGDKLDPPIQIPADLTQVTIAPNGIVTVTNTLSLAEEIGQIVLQRFVSPAGLLPDGNNLFYETLASGEPQEIEPDTPGGGRLLQGFVEGSNVNAIAELVNLIKGQRAYEINSNVIETADEALQIANNLRR